MLPPYLSIVKSVSIFGPEGWRNWGKEENVNRGRYAEYNSTGEGAAAAGKMGETARANPNKSELSIYMMCSDWKPEN